MTPFLLCASLAVAAQVDVDQGPPVLTAGDRVAASASAAVGAGAGGFVGGSLALGLSSLLAGFDARAGLLPLLVLPPVGAGLGAFLTASALNDSKVGLFGGAGAVGAATLWALVVGGLLVDDDDGLLSLPGGPGRFDLTFAATALVPAAVAVVGAGLLAPWFASPSE